MGSFSGVLVYHCVELVNGNDIIDSRSILFELRRFSFDGVFDFVLIVADEDDDVNDNFEFVEFNSKFLLF